MTDTTRDAFEKWFTTGDAGVRLHRVGDDYTLMTSQISWNAWQAATEQGKRQPPEGYQLVPIDPTEAMLSVGNVTLICGAYEVYRAMLSATPQGKI